MAAMDIIIANELQGDNARSACGIPQEIAAKAPNRKRAGENSSEPMSARVLAERAVIDEGLLNGGCAFVASLGFLDLEPFQVDCLNNSECKLFVCVSGHADKCTM